MTPKSLDELKSLKEMCDEVFETRKHLKYPPASLDEIAKNEFDAGFTSCQALTIDRRDVAKLVDALKEYKSEWENPVPDALYKRTCRINLFKSLEAFYSLHPEMKEL